MSSEHEHIFCLMQPDKLLDKLVREPYFWMVVHGVFGGEIVTIKISSESEMLEGGSSIPEALDRLFKLFWIFDVQHTVGCENLFKLLKVAIFSQLNDGPIPKSVTELLSVICKYKAQ
jgi:hypothetical protein